MSGERLGSTHSLSEVVSGLAGDVQDLVRGEIMLARSELDQKFHRFLIAAIWLLGGALLAFAGLVVVLQGVAFALAIILPAWAASLIVGVVIVLIGGLLARSGLAMLSLKALTPERTAANLEKDARMIKERS